MKKLLMFLSATTLFTSTLVVKAQGDATQETKAAEIFKTAVPKIAASIFIPRMVSNKICNNVVEFATKLTQHGVKNLTPKESKSVLLKVGVALALRPVSYVAPAYLTYDTYNKLNKYDEDILLGQPNPKS